MEKFKGIEIRKVAPVDISKGNTYEWCKGISGRQVTIYERAAGTKFADHFHKGDDLSKCPELFLLLYGDLRLDAYNGLTGEKLSEKITSKTEIKIDPFILHSMEALEDCTFIEYRAQAFDRNKPDTYPASEYDECIRQLKKEI